MERIDQDRVGSCSFIDVLEEAVLSRRPVAVELRDGSAFIDLVTDVTTESGRDFAEFRTHPASRCSTSAPPRAPSPPDAEPPLGTGSGKDAPRRAGPPPHRPRRLRDPGPLC
jgi:hypothetical protein